jgi:hypothetical protein
VKDTLTTALGKIEKTEAVKDAVRSIEKSDSEKLK